MALKPIIIRQLESSGDDHLLQALARMTDPWYKLLPLSNGKWQPNTDVLEADDHYLVRMELAGVDKESINIYYQGDHLIVYGNRLDPLSKSAIRYLQLEVNYHEFERILILLREIEPESIEADFDSGFLMIKIPKQRLEESISRQIKVNLK